MRDISLLPSTSASTTDYAHSLATQREDKKSCIEKGPNTNSWKGVDIVNKIRIKYKNMTKPTGPAVSGPKSDKRGALNTP